MVAEELYELRRLLSLSLASLFFLATLTWDENNFSGDVLRQTFQAVLSIHALSLGQVWPGEGVAAVVVALDGLSVQLQLTIHRVGTHLQPTVWCETQEWGWEDNMVRCLWVGVG